MRLDLFHKLTQIFVEKAGGKSESAWLQLADCLRVERLNCSEEKELIDAVLLQTPAGERNLQAYRNKVLHLARPEDPKAFDAARKAKVGLDQLIAIARGSKTFRDGKVIVVAKSAAGGWNEKSATQRIREGFDLAFAAATAAGIPLRELKLIYNERLRLAEEAAS